MDDKPNPEENAEVPGHERVQDKKQKASAPSVELDEDDTADDSDDSSGSAYNATPFQPIQSWKSWMILAAIFVVIAVAVLYVYQAGDRKTVLGNQPIPLEQEYAPTTVAALNAQGGGNVQQPQPDAPPDPAATTAVAVRPTRPAPSSPLPTAKPPSYTYAKSSVQCDRCGTTGLPVCASCGAVMQPVNQGGSTLFVCPVCGAVGIPICPQCGAHMHTVGPPVQARAAPGQASGQPVAAQSFTNQTGQFQCSVCGATGLPNWDQNGVPHCPSCNAPMTVR